MSASLAAEDVPHGVCVLRAHVARDEAVDAFTHGVVGAVRWLALGPLRSIADVYVPFRLYEVITPSRPAARPLVLGVDAVAGALDLYRFDNIPRSADLVNLHTRNHVNAVLSSSAARDVLLARVQRLLYQRVGFLAAGRCHVDVQPVGDVIHVPYWVGFFGRRDTASLVVMDAVRRQIEGVKVRRLIAEWLRAGQEGRK